MSSKNPNSEKSIEHEQTHFDANAAEACEYGGFDWCPGNDGVAREDGLVRCWPCYRYEGREDTPDAREAREQAAGRGRGRGGDA